MAAVKLDGLLAAPDQLAEIVDESGR